MPIQFDKFDQSKIDRLKDHLVSMAVRGSAKSYEIYVDGLKAVPKTEEPNDFDAYENYIQYDTEEIKIVIYNSNASPRNDQYVFMKNAKNRQEAVDLSLSGFGQESYSKQSLEQIRQKQISTERSLWEMEQIKKENEDLKQQLEEAEQYAEKLEQTIEQAKANGNKIGGIHWGEIAGVALEGIVRRNTKLIAEIPGGAALAGLIEADNAKTTSPEPVTEATFKRKEEVPPMSEHETVLREVILQLQERFTEPELDKVMEILDALADDKSMLDKVAQLLEQGESNF